MTTKPIVRLIQTADTFPVACVFLTLSTWPGSDDLKLLLVPAYFLTITNPERCRSIRR
jgi:hypothetical protein